MPDLRRSPMGSIRRYFRFSGLLIFILLASCGGGGSGGGSTASTETPVAITTANAEAAAGAGAANAQSTYEVASEGGDIVTGVSVRKAGAGPRLAAFANKQLRWILQNDVDTPPRLTGISHPDEVPCGVSGSVSVAFDDADNSLGLSAGDSFTLTFNNCIDYSDMVSVNGMISLRFNALSGNPLVDSVWSVDVTMTLANVVVAGGGDTATFNGDMSYALETQDDVNFMGSVKGNSLTIDINGVTESLSNYLIAFTENDVTLAYTVNANGTVSSTELGGYVQFETLATFEGVAPDYPYTGRMKITGEGNSSVTLTAIDSTNVQLEIDVDGDGTADQTLTTTWESLDS